jgi:DNA-binding FadR family transcriptional regulator
MQRHGDLHTRVVDKLGAAIVNGDLAEGQIIDLDRIEQELDVSRSVTREALRVLSSLGMIVARHKVGTRVLPRAEWNLLDPRVISWRSEGKDSDLQLHDLLQLRSGIEPLAARLAAGKLDAAMLAALHQSCDAMEAAALTVDRRAFLRADEVFHSTILAGCGNELVARFGQVVVAALEARQHESRAPITELTPPSLVLHRRLLRALERAGRGDPGRAAAQAERIARELVDLASVELGFE